MSDILLDAEGEDSVSACLKLSYFHLPSNLKQCFTMCSLFPKGHWIDKQQLIDQWIAHDMICLTPGIDDLELIGLRYFNSLVQVYFLQDVKEYNNGTVTCKMHDLIHDLARSILCEEISTIVPEDATSSTKGYRYFSLIEPRKFSPKKVFKNARVIYVDKGNDIIFGNTLKNAKRLHSIIIENSILSTPVLTAICQVKNLRYIGMPKLQCEALPEAITDVWSLQVLYLKACNLLKLPESIGKLKKLRTLNLSWCSMLKSIPDSIGDCQMLSTLDLEGCKAFADLPNSIGRNKRLRVLRLMMTRIHRLPSSITTLENLEYLSTRGDSTGMPSWVTLPEGIGNLTKLKELDLGYKDRLPPGIGKLTQLEKLNRFPVQTDKRSARISELATLSRITGKLSIHFLGELTDQSEAHQACLKQKEKLQELELSWGSRDYSYRKNREDEVVALDGLEPPLGIKEIRINRYEGGRFTSWMLKQSSGGVQGLCQFPFLTKMSLNYFPYLKNLDGLIQLPCLEELHLVEMLALESISGGPFPSLAKVKLQRLPSLGQVWIVTNSTLFGKEGEGCSNHSHHQSGQLQVGSRLTYLDIKGCPKLVVKPHLPVSLELLWELWLQSSNGNLMQSPCQGQGQESAASFIHLKVLKACLYEAWLHLSPPPSPGLRSGFRLNLLQALESLDISLCNDLIELPEYIGNLYSLKRMTIEKCDRLSDLPQSTGQLTYLQELRINWCPAFVQFPESLGELCSQRVFAIYDLGVLTCLPQSLCHLTSLKEFRIDNCKALVQLPEGLGGLCSLIKFNILCLPGLTCLPQSLCGLTSLQELKIGWCDALAELPEWLGELHSLRKLSVWGLDDPLTCLPQSLCRLATSLKELKISWCSGLKCLPEWIKSLTALQRLDIWWCPDLERRCERGTGEDWHLISHIPNLQIGWRDD